MNTANAGELPWLWEEVLTDQPPPLPPKPEPIRPAPSPRHHSPATRTRALQQLGVEELQARNRLKVDASAGALLLMRRFAADLRP